MPARACRGASDLTAPLWRQLRGTGQAPLSGQLAATGLLSGVVTTASGTTTSVLRTMTLPAAVGDASCQILHLDLGPISLDLLGLQIDLSRIVLDITAQSGAGNLLGNLLCAMANLLNVFPSSSLV